MEIFTDPWARAWGERLNESESYRSAARKWEGAVLLHELAEDGAVARSVYLDLLHGECLEARIGSEEDRAGAAYVIAAPRANWLHVLDGMSPISALLRGKLRLTKGALAALVPYAGAASELVAAARRIEPKGGTDETEEGERRPRDPDAGRADDNGPEAAHEEPAASEGGDVAGATRSYRTTGPEPLDFASEPMQLWEKAKRLGVWDPAAIDFSHDAEDWSGLGEAERDLLLRLASLFQAGEEAVTIDLLPLIGVIAAEGRLEEEMYLTSFLWEEAKHVEVFQRFFAAIGERDADLASYHTPSYERIFAEALPEAMGRLREDGSPAAQARASVTYNLVVEGVLAETGYHAYHEILTRNGILPGMQEAATLLKQDESRHLAYGVHLLSRLVREHGEPVWRVIEEEMDALLGPAIGIIDEAFSAYEPERMPFGLDPGIFVDFARTQFEKRLGHVERARGRPGAGG